MDLTALGLTAVVPVRLAQPADAEAIAQVHVQAWDETYAGILPPARIARASPRDRLTLWQRTLGGGGPTVFVAAPEGRVAGFLTLGRQRSAGLREQGFAAEVSALYLLRAVQGRGLGRALMSVAAHRLLDEGASGLALWALTANRQACGFYRALGGAEVAQRSDSDGPQTAFGWRAVEVLL